jgi:hypothetical protein
MGFTGKKALVWKKKFLQAFNLMEQTILNQTLFIIEDRFPGSVPFRDQLNRRQISFLATAEIVVSNAIADGMVEGMFYKEIYIFAKSKLDQLSASVGKTPVIYHSPIPQLIGPRQQSLLPEARA